MSTRMEVTLGGTTGPWTGGRKHKHKHKQAAGGACPTCPTGNCMTAYGPVANICQSTMPVTRMVPVTEQIPITTVMPIPNMVMPRTTAGAPVAATMGKPMGKPMPMPMPMSPWGKAAMVPMAPPAVIPALPPGIYTTDAWITGV